MKTKEITMIAVLMAVGSVLHFITPGIFFGVKPDFHLIMMFMAIMLAPRTKAVLTVGVVAGLLAAMTTSFPGGQIPNIIDKIITSLVFFIIYINVKQYKDSKIAMGLLSAVGTIISGTVFLSVALFTVGLPIALSQLFVMVVLPTALINAFAMFVLFTVVKRIGVSVD